MHPCSQQLNYNPSSYHLHASFMAKFILCGRTHTLSYIPYCASCYFRGFLTDIYTPIHTPARPHNVLHSSSIIIGASLSEPLSSVWCETGSHGTSKPDGTAVETGWYDRTSGRGLPLARDRSAAEPPAPRFTAILADTAELSHCQERPGLVNLPIGPQGQHC